MAKLIKEIWLIRHATTFYNEADILQGSTDNPLSPKGVSEATQLAEHLKSEKFDIFFSSPLKRALQTAELINTNHKSPLEILPQLREISFGTWEGIHFPKIKTEYAAEFRNWHRTPRYKPDGGESFYQVYRRVCVAMRAILAEERFKIAVVGHATVNRAALACLFKLPLQTVRFFRLANCSVSLFYIFSDEESSWPVMSFWNRIYKLNEHE